jgi:hypothetical protein
MSTSSEEFRKFVNRLLYEDTSKFNCQQNMKILLKRPLLKFIMNKILQLYVIQFNQQLQKANFILQLSHQQNSNIVTLATL